MELISRERAIAEIEMMKPFTTEVMIENIKTLINHCPTIESRPKGEWVGIDEEPHEEWECCNCGNIINTYMQDELEEYKYCHKCGAKMSTPWADMRGEE